MLSYFVLPHLVLAILAAPLPAQSREARDALAPDGHRGLGESTPLKGLLPIFRERHGRDAEFLEELARLSGDVRLQLAGEKERCRALGAFDLVGPRPESNLAELYEAFRRAERDPMEVLGSGGAAARAFALLLADTRFQVRMQIADGWERDARELTASLAVLRAVTDGFVQLDLEETRNVCARADLAASRLRALRSDLQVLRTDVSVEAQLAELEAGAAAMAAIARMPDIRARWEAWERSRDGAQALAGRMRAALFTARLEPRITPLLQWRERLLAAAATKREDALVLLPETPQGRAAPADVQALGRSKRMQGALLRAREGLLHDPLDEELVWIAAHTADFLWGLIESRPLYDRYLALRGIRAHDDRTLRSRKLEPRELEALEAVQRGFIPRMHGAR
jgi:hypothetical protein